LLAVCWFSRSGVQVSITATTGKEAATKI